MCAHRLPLVVGNSMSVLQTYLIRLIYTYCPPLIIAIRRYVQPHLIRSFSAQAGPSHLHL
jgi:hypothetical protein